MRSGVTVPGDGVSGTSTAVGAVGAAGAMGAGVGLEVDLVRLADLDLLEALDLLEILARLGALAAGALGTAMPLVVTAIGGRGVIECDLWYVNYVGRTNKANGCMASSSMSVGM